MTCVKERHSLCMRKALRMTAARCVLRTVTIFLLQSSSAAADDGCQQKVHGFPAHQLIAVAFSPGHVQGYKSNDERPSQDERFLSSKI